jgi:hypothetical protein
MSGDVVSICIRALEKAGARVNHGAWGYLVVLADGSGREFTVSEFELFCLQTFYRVSRDELAEMPAAAIFLPQGGAS